MKILSSCVLRLRQIPCTRTEAARALNLECLKCKIVRFEVVVFAGLRWCLRTSFLHIQTHTIFADHTSACCAPSVFISFLLGVWSVCQVFLCGVLKSSEVLIVWPPISVAWESASYLFVNVNVCSYPLCFNMCYLRLPTLA